MFSRDFFHTKLNLYSLEPHVVIHLKNGLHVSVVGFRFKEVFEDLRKD